jgi:hypothetical protein
MWLRKNDRRLGKMHHLWIGLIFLYFVFFRAKPTAPTETPGGQNESIIAKPSVAPQYTIA